MPHKLLNVLVEALGSLLQGLVGEPQRSARQHRQILVALRLQLLMQIKEVGVAFEKGLLL